MDAQYVHEWRDNIKSQKSLGPTLFICGDFYEGSEFIDKNENIRKDLIKAKQKHDFIKLYGYLSKKDFSRIMKIAKQENIHTIGHLPHLVGLDNVIKGGMDELAHMNDLTYDLIDYPSFTFLRNIVFGLAIKK